MRVSVNAFAYSFLSTNLSSLLSIDATSKSTNRESRFIVISAITILIYSVVARYILNYCKNIISLYENK